MTNQIHYLGFLRNRFHVINQKMSYTKFVIPFDAPTTESNKNIESNLKSNPFLSYACLNICYAELLQMNFVEIYFTLQPLNIINVKYY